MTLTKMHVRRNIIARFTLKSTFAGLALAGTLAATALPGTVHAQSIEARPSATPQCALTVVHLHANNPQTVDPFVPVDCSSGSVTFDRVVSNGVVAPNTGTNCTSGSELFYSDINKGGNVLCLTDWGWSDMSAIPYPGIGQSWNDKISSFLNRNIYAGNAYENSQSQGLGAKIPVFFNYYAPDLRTTNINGHYYGDWNDRISEVCIDGPGVNCPPTY